MVWPPPLHLAVGQSAVGKLERVMGIEPTLSAWEAEVLPLNYTRAVGNWAPGTNRDFGGNQGSRKGWLARAHFLPASRMLVRGAW